MKTILSALLLSFAMTSPSVAAEPDAAALGCKIQKSRAGWLKTLEQTETRWGVSVEAQLSILADEWGLTADDLPAIWRPDWTIPKRGLPSIAPGYQEATWNRYKFQTGNQTASFKSLSDMSDFIGWYISTSASQVGLLSGDAAGVFILWKKGPRYYQSRQWVSDTTMIYRSQHFALQAQQISEGFQTCFERNKNGRLIAEEAEAQNSAEESLIAKITKPFRPWSWKLRRGAAD